MQILISNFVINLAQIESIVNSDDCLYIDGGFEVHFIIFDGSQKPLPKGSFNQLIFKRPKSKLCAKTAKYFKSMNCENFQNLLKGGIIDLTVLQDMNCLISSLAFGLFLQINNHDLLFCLKKMFKYFYNNLNKFCEHVLGFELIKKIILANSFTEAIDIFCSAVLK